MIISNLLATITVLLSTNAVEHWPQKLVGMVPNPGYAAWAANKHTHPYTLEYCAPEIQQFGDETNADTKSVETTVTGKRMFIATFEDTGLPAITLSNWTVEHYSVDYVRVRTNGWAHFPDSSFSLPDGTKVMLSGADVAGMFSYPTNWFEPVATNQVSATATTPATNVFIFYQNK